MKIFLLRVFQFIFRNTFLKWFLAAILFLGLIVGIEIIRMGKINYDTLLTTSIFCFCASIFLATVFWFIEGKYIPFRKRKIIEKIISNVDGKEVKESLISFGYQKLYFYAELEINLSMSKYGGYSETIIISVVVPENILMKEMLSRKYKLRIIEGVSCFQLFSTTPLWIKKIKSKIDNAVL